MRCGPCGTKVRGLKERFCKVLHLLKAPVSLKLSPSMGVRFNTRKNKQFYSHILTCFIEERVAVKSFLDRMLQRSGIQ